MLPVTTRIALVALTAWLLSGPLFAQTTLVPAPDFSGVWTMDRTRSEAAAQEQPAGDIMVTISQTPASLTIETIRDGTKETAIYPVEQQVTDTAQVPGKRRAYFDGSVLVDE